MICVCVYAKAFQAATKKNKEHAKHFPLLYTTVQLGLASMEGMQALPTIFPNININILDNFPHAACPTRFPSVMHLLEATSSGQNKQRASRTLARLSRSEHKDENAEEEEEEEEDEVEGHWDEKYVFDNVQSTAWVRRGVSLSSAIQSLRLLVPLGSTVLHWGGSDATFLQQSGHFSDLDILDLRSLFIDDMGGLYPKVGSIPFALADLHKAYDLPHFKAHVANLDARATLEVACELWKSVTQQAAPVVHSALRLSSDI